MDDPAERELAGLTRHLPGRHRGRAGTVYFQRAARGAAGASSIFHAMISHDVLKGNGPELGQVPLRKPFLESACSE